MRRRPTLTYYDQLQDVQILNRLLSPEPTVASSWRDIVTTPVRRPTPDNTGVQITIAQPDWNVNVRAVPRSVQHSPSEITLTTMRRQFLEKHPSLKQ